MLWPKPTIPVINLPPNLRRSRSSAMTLTEVVIALSIMALIMAGILSTFMQTRRLSAASIAQNCAVTIVQGYIEQLKGINLHDFVNALPNDTQNSPNLATSYAIPTRKDQTTQVNLADDPPNALWTTPPAIPLSTLTGATPGVTPAGVVDNLQTFDMNSQAGTGTTTWAAIWPGANTTLKPYPAYDSRYPTNTNPTPGASDLHMNFWVQITDLTPTATPLCKAYGIVIVYTWQYVDGSKVKYAMGTVRTVRSAVQTF